MELPNAQQVFASDLRVHLSKISVHVNHFHIADKRRAAYDSVAGRSGHAVRKADVSDLDTRLVR